MKGAIGNTMVMNIVITFIILTTAFLIGSISYSKAFKVKTKIVDIIEKYYGDFESGKSGNEKSKIMQEIETFLGQIGYRSGVRTCSTDVVETSNYDICIYKVENKDENGNDKTYKGPYYTVVVYMYFDFPVIGDMIKIPVTGQTKSFNTSVS